MSYGITPLAVELRKVEQAIGSHDAALADSVKQERHYRFEQDRCDDEAEPSLEEALDALLSGKELLPGFGHKYAYALEMLCRHFGHHLPNQCFSGIRGKWTDEVDEALKAAGVPKADFSFLDHLMYRGSPVQIPEPDDFPCIGFLKAHEIGPALRAVQAADVSLLDPELQDAVREINGWLEECARLQCDLICFYY